MGNPRSLTGDPVTDELVPIAQQLIDAVHNEDPDAVDAAFAEAITATGGRCDPGQALAILCAAMVPENASPAGLLAWWGYRAEYERLTATAPPATGEKCSTPGHGHRDVHARGLCDTCYTTARRHRVLDRHPAKRAAS
jgi:hypothetical protein